MKLFQYGLSLLSYPFYFGIFIFENLQFEHKLWDMHQLTSRVIRWATHCPNDHNLQNLILWRHQLRQIHYNLVNEENLEDGEFWQIKSGKRLLNCVRTNIHRIEDAMQETETALG